MVRVRRVLYITMLVHQGDIHEHVLQNIIRPLVPSSRLALSLGSLFCRTQPFALSDSFCLSLHRDLDPQLKAALKEYLVARGVVKLHLACSYHLLYAAHVTDNQITPGCKQRDRSGPPYADSFPGTKASRPMPIVANYLLLSCRVVNFLIVTEMRFAIFSFSLIDYCIS